MSRFKIGQKVICVNDKPTRYLKKGNTYIISGFYCCAKCGISCVELIGLTNIVRSECSKCGYEEIRVRPAYREDRFSPLANISDAIEYRLSVSIPELTKIQETQLS